MNYYLNEINTKIIKRKYVSNRTHIVLKDNIMLDYKKYNIKPEDIYINDEKVFDIYNSSLGAVYIVNFKPETDQINIKIDFYNRISILKSLTARLLINSVLQKYLNIKATNFYTNKDLSSFEIEGIFFENEVNNIKNILNNNINEYLNYALDIKTNKDSNLIVIEGLLEAENIPTISNLSEIKSFEIKSFEIKNSLIKFYYNTL